ncbi:MAG: hypothetical protein IJR35_04685 [Synergistaceae bacterium]|nr:hypothetical protein [Synergistaceae bacterium]
MRRIDRIVDTTQFNRKRLLDGSCCGTCTSTDTTTKGYIRGAIDIEGNYRIDVRTNPGQAQVQKSSIFKVKHENTVTNAQMDSDSGIGNIEIDNVPAGDFKITATKAGGGETTTTYTSKLTGTVAEANTSGFNEKLTLTFTDSEGNTAQTTVSLADTDNTKELVSAAIARQLNDTEIEINDISYKLSASDNGNATYSVLSEGNNGSIVRIASSSPVIDANPSTTLSRQNQRISTRKDSTTLYTRTASATVTLVILTM